MEACLFCLRWKASPLKEPDYKVKFNINGQWPPRIPECSVAALQCSRAVLTVRGVCQGFLSFRLWTVLSFDWKHRAGASSGQSRTEAVICNGNYWWHVQSRLNSGICDRLHLVICLRYIICWAEVRGMCPDASGENVGSFDKRPPEPWDFYLP
jgi:hypothetical protein